MTSAKNSIVLGVTGSIAVYKACEITTALVKDGIEVDVVMTREAVEFVRPLTFQTLSGNQVTIGMFETPAEWNPLHTALAQKAKLILIAPATANIIGKLASGVCDDILTCIVYATGAPVLIAPAMNVHMYKHAIVQENIEKLKKIGYKFIGPVAGRLACGCDDMGHIADIKDIVTEAKRLLK